MFHDQTLPSNTFVEYYSTLLEDATQEAVTRMVNAAKVRKIPFSTIFFIHHFQELGATEVVAVRFETTTTMNRLIVGMHASCVCYGTAISREKSSPPKLV